MKTNLRPNFSTPALPLFALVATGALLCVGDGRAQVVIEGGPGVIQISDRDGKPEPVVPGGVPQGAPVPLEREAPGPVTIETQVPQAVTIQPDPTSPVTVRVPVKPAPPVATPPDEPAIVAAREVDVTAAKRKAEIIRELNIADSGTGAKVAILAAGLYVEGGAPIDPIADEKLALLAEFIRLSDQDGVTVTYHYTPDLHLEALAWDRSVSFVEWMKTKGKLPQATFTVEDPVKILETPGASVAVDPATAPPYGKIEVEIRYRS